MSTEGQQAAKVAALVAGGAVIGAGLGLLFAPRSGAETRRAVRHFAKRAEVWPQCESRNGAGGAIRQVAHG